MSEESKGLEEQAEQNEAKSQNDSSQQFDAIAQRIESVQSQLAEQQQLNNELVSTLQNLQKQQVGIPQENMIQEDNFYDLNPVEYKERIRKEVRDDIMNEVSNQQRAEAARSQAIAAIVAEYPEANQDGSPLQTEILKQFKQIPENIRNTAEAYEAAASRAAKLLKVLPKSLRQENTMNNDDFSVSGGSGKERPNRQRKKDEIAPETAELARLMGLNVDDPKVQERLKERSQRRDWKRYK